MRARGLGGSGTKIVVLGFLGRALGHFYVFPYWA